MAWNGNCSEENRREEKKKCGAYAMLSSGPRFQKAQIGHSLLEVRQALALEQWVMKNVNSLMHSIIKGCSELGRWHPRGMVVAGLGILMSLVVPNAVFAQGLICERVFDFLDNSKLELFLEPSASHNYTEDYFQLLKKEVNLDSPGYEIPRVTNSLVEKTVMFLLWRADQRAPKYTDEMAYVLEGYAIAILGASASKDHRINALLNSIANKENPIRAHDSVEASLALMMRGQKIENALDTKIQMTIRGGNLLAVVRLIQVHSLRGARFLLDEAKGAIEEVRRQTNSPSHEMDGFLATLLLQKGEEVFKADLEMQRLTLDFLNDFSIQGPLVRSALKELARSNPELRARALELLLK